MKKLDYTPEKLISQLAYAKHRGCSHGAVAKAIKSGRLKHCLHTDEKGRISIDPVMADAEWDKNTNQAKQRQDSKPAPAPEPARYDAPPAEHAADDAASFADARAHREKYQALLAQLDYEERAGKLIDAEVARTAAFKVAREARNALLELPDRLAAELAGIDSQFECHKLLTTEIRLVCDQLAKFVIAPEPGNA